jgi:serine protease Do
MRQMRTLFMVLFIALIAFYAGKTTQYSPTLPQVGVGGGPETSDNSTVVNIVEAVNPSVVTIALTAQIPSLRDGTQQVEGNIGSGFVLTTDGYVATNKHVVSAPIGEYSVLVNNQEYKVQQISRDPTNDIAILKINATNLHPLSLGDSAQVRLGENVIAIGTTLGEFSNSVTTGVVSGLHRNINADSSIDETTNLTNLIQTDAAINPGNSGGPLLNNRGQVIGLNTAIVGGAQNIGFVLPINSLKSFALSKGVTPQ